MAVLKCQHCEYTREVSEQYAGKSVKCPSCKQTTTVYDTTVLLTAFSDKMLEFQSEIQTLKQNIQEQNSSIITSTANPVVTEELTHALQQIFRENRIAMTEFSDTIKRQEAINFKVNSVNTSFIRFGIFSFIVLCAIILFFMMQFIKTTDIVSTQLNNINNTITTVNHELVAIKDNINKSNLNNNNNQQVLDTVSTMQSRMTDLNQELSRVQAQIKEVSNKYDALNYRPYR